MVLVHSWLAELITHDGTGLRSEYMHFSTGTNGHHILKTTYTSECDGFGFRRLGMIELPKSLTVENCEKVLCKLETKSCDELLLPVETAKFAFAGMASAIQAVITWGRRSPKRLLRLRHSNKDLAEQIEEVMRRPHKFTAAMFAKSILSGTDFIEIRDTVNQMAREAVERQFVTPYGSQFGQLCWFAFVDHSSKGFDPHFYITNRNAKPEPRQLEQLQAVIIAMMAKSAQVAGGGQLPSPNDLNHVGRIIYELFLNTHEHGSRSANRSEWIKPGVRILYTNGINLSPEGKRGTIKQEPVLNQYLSCNQGRSRYMEVSVIDSGLGYFGRWLSDNNQSKPKSIDTEQEHNVFKKCFMLRQSSTGDDFKGNGLPVVMDRLTRLKGFMRIRSGHLALFRNFIENPYTDSDGCEFFDWSTMKSTDMHLTPHADVDGVAVTLLIPMEASKP